MNFRLAGLPPSRRILAVMETDAPELPRVAENERARFLLQDEMVMFAGAKAGQLDPQFAAHPEVNPQPVITGETKEHLLAPGNGALQSLPNE